MKTLYDYTDSQVLEFFAWAEKRALRWSTQQELLGMMEQYFSEPIDSDE